MAQAWHVFVGFASTLVVVGGLIWGAARAASILPGRVGGVDRLSATLAIALLQVVGVTTFLAAIGLFFRWTALPLSLAVSVAIGLAASRRRQGAPWSDVAGSLRAALKSEPLVIPALLPAAVAVGMCVAYAMARPPLGYDAINYHVPLAAHFVQAHDLSVFRFPAYYDPYPYFPAVGEMFSAWAFVLFGCDMWLPFVNLPFLALLVLSMYGLCRESGAGRVSSAAVAAAAASVPAVFNVLTESYVELVLWAFFLAALRWALLAARVRSMGILLVAACLAGVLPGVKQVGFVMAPLAFVLTVAAGSGARAGRAAKAAIVFAGALVVFGSAFYVRNWIVAGNPLFPFPVDIAGLNLFEGTPGLSDRAASTSVFAHFDYLWDSGKLFHAFVGRSGTTNSSWGMGPFGVLSLVGGAGAAAYASRAAVRGNRDDARVHGLLVVVGLALVCMYVFLPRSGTFVFSNVRFVFPGVAVLAVAGAGAWARFGLPQAVLAVVVISCQVAGLALFTNLPVTSGAVSAGVAVAAVMPAGWWILRYRGREPAGPRATGSSAVYGKPALAGLLLIAVVATFALHGARESSRVAAYGNRDFTWQFDFSSFVPCIEALDDEIPSGKLALAGTRDSGGFVSPLFGADFGRRPVVVVSTAAPDGDAADPATARGSWLESVEGSGASALLVFLPGDGSEPVPELRWAEGAGGLLEPVHRSDRCRLFRVRKGGDQ